jgi:hypothetical protein
MGQSLRSLAAEAGVPVHECAHRLRSVGLKATVGAQRLEGHDLAAARQALGLTRHRSAPPPGATGHVVLLGEDEMIVRLLRPLREKGKVGRKRTTPIEHLHGHGVPDHQKDAAKELAEGLLQEGCLAEKVSQGRRHVWLTAEGQARLRQAEGASSAEDGAGSGGGPSPACRTAPAGPPTRRRRAGCGPRPRRTGARRRRRPSRCGGWCGAWRGATPMRRRADDVGACAACLGFG